ncbi:hypothetical protein PVK06_027727 [Gossypium arboreum]|uniref:Secreted protein n=1 Tax=Gossypium arboreum TaxID=29729 RepID=A0ABR0P120_GOSAR|nr:hypothetical protein PVK06_027727 [Gossypium arboreum]
MWPAPVWPIWPKLALALWITRPGPKSHTPVWLTGVGPHAHVAHTAQLTKSVSRRRPTSLHTVMSVVLMSRAHSLIRRPHASVLSHGLPHRRPHARVASTILSIPSQLKHSHDISSKNTASVQSRTQDLLHTNAPLIHQTSRPIHA